MLKFPFVPVTSIALLLLIVAEGGALQAQQQQVVLQKDIYFDIDRNASDLRDTTHTGMRPLLESWANTRNVIGFRQDSSVYYYELTQKLFKERLIEVKGKDYHLTADPMFHFEIGKDFRDPSAFADTNLLYVNTRGAWFSGDLGSKVSFQTAFFENQDLFPQYIYQQTRLRGVVPGQGRTKDFNGRAFDHGWASGYLSYTPVTNWNLQFGHGKHFVGNGHRSMLLSDAAFNYPYLKSSLRLLRGKLQYTTIYAKLQQLFRLPTGDAAERLFYWKRATFQHLSMNFGERVQVGLFEGTIWRTIDSTGVRPFNAMTMNPVIGLNTAVNGFQSEHQEIVGLDLKLRLIKGLFVYGQLAIDDPAQQKYGWQLGAQAFDLPVRHLHLQVEYNSATPYMYANKPSTQNYGHYNEPLAHPYGAYFDEFLFFVDYRLYKWTLSLQYTFANYNLDGATDVDHGSDIFGADRAYANTDGPLIQRELNHVHVRGSYLMNQNTNMRLTAGYIHRDLSNSFAWLQTGYFYVAWHTSLFNKYYDF